MATLYRVDYADDNDTTHAIACGQHRNVAQRKAARLSLTHGTAYVIRADGGQDVGQRVYVHGVKSHDDDAY